MVQALTAIDIVCIVVYFVLVLTVGLWATFKYAGSSTSNYFLTGKQMHWFMVRCGHFVVLCLNVTSELFITVNLKHVREKAAFNRQLLRLVPLIGTSIFASNVGATMFLGLAGSGAAAGFSVVVYEWHAVPLLIALGWVFLPVYSASGAYTMPEYLKKRYGGERLRIMLSVMSLIIFIIIRISIEIFAGAIFIQQILGLNLYASIGGLLLLTMCYTMAGGLAAVMYTNALQTSILLVGACIIFFKTLIIDAGGWDSFLADYGNAVANSTLLDIENRSCGLPLEDYRHIWRSPVTGDIPWTGAIFGLTPVGVSAWCTDQIVVQRCLAAKNLSHAKRGALLAAAFKILPFFLFIVPGMISRVLFPDEVACSDPESCFKICGNEAGCTNIAYPLLILHKLPLGFKGVMLAALFAAIMGRLTSTFNSASALITIDIWRKFRSKANENELMVVGRVSVVVMVGLSIIWIPIMQRSQGGQLWNYLQSIGACISPTWCWLFLLGMFWKGTTEAGAFWGVVIGTLTGMIRMALQFSFFAPLCGSDEEDSRPGILKDVHFLHFAIILSVVTIMSIVGISFFTQKRTPEQLRRVTWWTRHCSLDPGESDSEDEEGDDDMGGNGDKIESFDIEETHQPAHPTWKARFLFWFLGVDSRPKAKISKAEKVALMKRMTAIEEKPFSKTVTNLGAITLTILVVYLIGMFH